MSERPKLFEDLQPVAVEDVAAIVGDGSTAERLDGPKSKSSRSRKTNRRKKGDKGRTTPKKPAPKKVKGEKFRPSDRQWLQLVACFKPLWKLGLQFEELIDPPSCRLRRGGRPRKYRTPDVLLFEVAGWKFGSYEWVSDNFADLDVWNELRDAVAAAYPNDPKMRLSKTPMNRDRHYRFRTTYLCDHLLQSAHDIIDTAAVEGGQEIGILEPGLGSLTNPDTRSFVSADGCWVPALTKLTIDDAVDRETGEIVRRFDPDAIPYHTNDGQYAGSPGFLMVMVQGRTAYTGERIVFSTNLKSGKNKAMPRNDATIAVDNILELIEKFPYFREGLTGVVYDMALSVADFDRLLDAGLIPVSKVPLTKAGKVAVENLGEETFTTRDGTTATRIVTAVNGTPCVTFVDRSGKDFYMPLKLNKVKKEHRKQRPQFSTHWSIPNNPLVPASLRGAKARVRHTRTLSERNVGKSRSRALRIFPESDQRFDDIFGLREDSESANSDYKNRLWNKRCRTMRHESVEFNNIGYQMHVLITALVAYHNRTGADMTEWFGLHELPTKQKRHLALAA